MSDVPDKKVLIVTYYWPPSGGSGVQRWLKFVKYLPACGCKPYIFTPENPSFEIKDPTLQKDVPPEAEIIRFPIQEPYEAFFRISGLFGAKKTAKPTDLVSNTKTSFFQRFSTWVRGNLFFPDPRVFWVRPSVRFLHGFLKEHGINTIITTGPPHSLHLIGLKLKKKNPSLQWFADFRDPWSEWGLLDTLKVSKRARKIHKRLEAKVLGAADKIFTITPFYVRQFERLAQRKVELLTNGFDEDDFRDLTIRRPDKFVVRHAGIVNEKCNPRPFMVAVQELMREREDFANSIQIDFVGEVHPQFRLFVESSEALATITLFTPSVSHDRVIELYGTSSVLLFVLNGYKDAEGYMPGKLFEYLATGLPVLGVGPEQGDAAHLLNSTGAGKMIDASDIAAIKKFLLEKFEYWKKDQAASSTIKRPAGAEAYSRKELTKKLVGLI